MYKITITQDEYDQYQAVLSRRREFLWFHWYSYQNHIQCAYRGLIEHQVNKWKRKYNVLIIDDRT